MDPSRWKAKIRQSLQVPAHVWNHPSNEGHRAQALALALNGRARMYLSSDHATVVEREGISFKVQAGQPGINRVLYAWPPDRNEMLAWQRILRPGDLFIDVGANAGVYTLWASHLGCHVTAFEPSSDVWELLGQNIALNGFNVQTERVAVGAADGTATFTRGKGPTNSLISSGDARSGNPHSSEEVPVRSLDSIFPSQHITGIKIDVEGFERNVLEGMPAILSEARVDCIQLEWNSTSHAALGEDRKPCGDILTASGYVLCRPGARGELIPTSNIAPSDADMFAVSPQRASQLAGVV